MKSTKNIQQAERDLQQYVNMNGDILTYMYIASSIHLYCLRMWIPIGALIIFYVGITILSLSGGQ